MKRSCVLVVGIVVLAMLVLGGLRSPQSDLRKVVLDIFDEESKIKNTLSPSSTPSSSPSSSPTTAPTDNLLMKFFQPVTAEPHLPLTDPLHTPRFKKYTGSAQDFPTPSFQGCNARGLCQYSNVCYSGNDNLQVFKVPNFDKVNENVTKDGLPWYTYKEGTSRWITVPRRPQLFTKFYDQEVYFADSLFVFNCWHQQKGKTNPAHWMMGIGKLFVAAMGYYFLDNEQTNKPRFDVVLYHQCPIRKSWAWAQMIEKLIWDYALSKNIITLPFENSINDAKIILPWHTKHVICGRKVYQEPFSSAQYLGNNSREVVDEWQQLIENYVATINLTTNADVNEKEIPHVTNNTLGDLSSNATLDTCCQKLRFAVWKRSEGTGLRHLTNLDEIKSVIGKYSHVPVSIATALSKTPFEDQVALFRSFDVLITSHGSHLANMIFSRRNSTVFIEVSAIHVDHSFTMNGQAYAKKWINTYGHAPTESRLLSEFPRCLAEDVKNFGSRENCRTLRSQFLQSDLVVNITTLQTDIEDAIETLCPGSIKNAKPRANSWAKDSKGNMKVTWNHD